MKTAKMFFCALVIFACIAGNVLAADNLLTNPSFETGTTLATGWSQYRETAYAPAYTLSTTVGVVDGEKSQRIQYTGDVADTNTMFTMYQSPVACVVGDTVEFSVYVRGAVTGATTKLVVGSYTAGNVEVNENAVTITPTETPTKYTVSYKMPEETDHARVAVFISGVNDGSTVDLYVDSADSHIVPPETVTTTPTSNDDVKTAAKTTAANTTVTTMSIIGAILILIAASAMIVAVKGELSSKALVAMVFGIVICISLAIVGCIVLGYVDAIV